MARIRSLKPEAFTSETLAACTVQARWTFAGLWCYVDDEARGRANVGLIKAAVWPLDDDVTNGRVSELLDELEAARLICRYEVDGKHYMHVVNFSEHQHPNRPLPSKLPECPRDAHGGLSECSVSAQNKGPGDSPGTVAKATGTNDGPEPSQTGHSSGESAGRATLTENAVSPHGGLTTKSSSTPPTPLRYEQGEVVGDGDGVPPTAGDASAPPTAQTILASFIDWDRAQGGQLTKRVTGQLAKCISDLLGQNISDRFIRTGLANWRASGQNPSTLDSFVSAAMKGAGTPGNGRSSSAPDRARGWIAAGREYAEAAEQAGRELPA